MAAVWTADEAGSEAPWRRRETLAAVAIGLGLALLYLSTASYGPAQVNDTRAASIASWSLGTQGSAALPETWPASLNYWGAEGRDGRVVVNRFPGVAYWAAPAYAVAALVQGDDAPAHPFLVDPAPAAIAAALTGTAVAVVLFVLLRGLTSLPIAAAATLTVAVGTSLWSVAADAMWPHAPAMLALTGMLLAWRRSHPAAAAVCAAVAVLVRPHLVVVPLLLALYVWRRARAADAGALAAGGLIGLAALSAYTAWAFGSLLPVAGYDVAGHLGGAVSRSPWRSLGDLGLVFVSPSRGLLTFSPFLGACLLALAVSWRRLPSWTLASAAAGLLYLMVQVRAVGYRGGEDFFAYRVSLEPVLLAAPALVLGTVETARRYRWLAPVLALLTAVSVGVHAYGAVVGGMPAETVRAWEDIDAIVREQYGHFRLGEVDLRHER